MEMEADSGKPFKIKDVTRNIKKSVVAATLEEMRLKAAHKFEKLHELPTIHLDSDGTEVDDEEYFCTLEDNTELIAVFSGEHWIDRSQNIAMHNHRRLSDLAYENTKAERVQRYVGQMQNNYCNLSNLSDPDLESLSNMDPNSLVDITGKELMEQLKDSEHCVQSEALRTELTC